MLVFTISINFDELFQNSRLAPVAALCKPCRVVVVAIYIPTVLVVAVLGAESGWTHRTGEVVDMVFSVNSGYIRAP